MRILFLTPWYPDERTPHHGVFVRDQAAAAGRVHDVVTISAKVDYDSFKLFSWKLEQSTFENITEYRLVIKRSIPVFNQLNYLLISVWISYRIAKQFKPHAIHGNIAYPGAIWSYCVSKLISRPYIVSDHTSCFTDNFRSFMHKALTMFAMRRARHVIAVSTWAANRIEDIVGRPVDIIPNLIHVNDYTHAECNEGLTQLGFLGGLSSEIHRKGLDLLIKAMAGIKEDYVLHIGGTGRFLNYYKALAHDYGIFEKCRFHGFVSSVPDFMKGLHFFVSSSRIEAFGMVIVEAMASGLPVVATNSGGPIDFVDESCGKLVSSENVGELQNAISWMIEHHRDFNKDEIRKKVRHAFSAEAFLQRMNAVYQGLH